MSHGRNELRNSEGPVLVQFWMQVRSGNLRGIHYKVLYSVSSKRLRYSRFKSLPIRTFKSPEFIRESRALH